MFSHTSTHDELFSSARSLLQQFWFEVTGVWTRLMTVEGRNTLNNLQGENKQQKLLKGGGRQTILGCEAPGLKLLGITAD